MSCHSHNNQNYLFLYYGLLQHIITIEFRGQIFCSTMKNNNFRNTENFGKHDFYYYSIYSSQLKKFQQALPEKYPLDQGNDSENLLKHRYDTRTAPEHLT